MRPAQRSLCFCIGLKDISNLEFKAISQADHVGDLILLSQLVKDSFIVQSRKVIVDDISQHLIALLESNRVLLGIQGLFEDRISLAALDLILGNSHVDRNRIQRSCLQLRERGIVISKLLKVSEGRGKISLVAIFFQKRKGS